MKKRFIIYKLIFLALLLLSASLLAEEGKVLSKVKYVFPNQFPGEVIEVKRVLGTDGVVYFISSSPINCPDLDALYNLKKQEYSINRGIYGNIFGILQQIYDEMSTTDIVDVEVRLKTEIANIDLENQFGINPDSIQKVTDSVLISSANKQNLDKMKSDSDVEYVIKYTEGLTSGGDEDWEGCPDLNVDPNFFLMRDWTIAAYNFPEDVSDVDMFPLPNGNGIIDIMETYGGTGEDIRVGTAEAPIKPYYFSNLANNYTLADINDMNISLCNNPNKEEDTHAEMTLRCALDAAPKCILFHDLIYPLLDDDNVHSFSLSAADGPNIDYYAYKFLANGYRPFFSSPSDNHGIGFDPGWQHYNLLNVGGATVTWNLDGESRYYEVIEQPFYIYDDDNNEWISVSTGTGTRTQNPYLINLGGYISDRELPHVVTNTKISCFIGSAKDELMAKEFRRVAMTSAGAPTVNGIAGCVMSASTLNQSNSDIMKNNPENVKVALMVTAENIDGGYWNPLEDGRDGCGMVSGFNAALYAHDVIVVNQNTPSEKAEHGIGFGEINEQTNDVLSFTIEMPSSFPPGKHLRAVLTWSSSVYDVTRATSVISDLNLELRHKDTNKWIGGCYSFEDNVEVIDIPQSKLNIDDEYTLDVIIDYLNIPVESLDQFIFYSVGWTWVEDFAGKRIKIFDATDEYELLNRNINVGPNVHFDLDNDENVSITASDRIILEPFASGDKITLEPGDERSQIKAEVCKLIHSYIVGPGMGKILYDMSGEMDGYEFTDAPQDINELLPPIAITLNHFDRCNPETSVGGISSDHAGGFEWAGYFDGQDYYELDINNINCSDPDNPIFEKIHQELPSYPGITLSTWLRFPENIEDGYIFCATDETGEKGFYLKVVNERLVFYLGLDGSANNSVSYQIVSSDLDNGNASNKRWIHVVAVWDPEEFLQFYINGEAQIPVTSGIISEYYSASDVRYFIGRGFDKNEPYFKGCIESVKWYAGVLKPKFIESQYYEGNYPDAPVIPDPIVLGSAYRHLIVNCRENGSINYNFTNYRYSTLNALDSYTFYLTKNAFLKFLDLIPEPGYEPMMTFQGAEIDIKTDWRWGDLFPNKEDEIENNNSIVVYFNELPDYVPGIDYEPGYRVIANGGRIYECLLTHGPSYPYNLGPYEPQYPSTTLLDYYWVEIWQSDDLFYQGIETGGSYNRHIVQFPYYSSDDKYNWFICNHDNYSSVNNDPQNNNEDWKSVNYQTDINYNPGDIVLGQGAYSPFTFKCIMENGPNSSNGIQEPSETDFINEYWIGLWSPGRCYGDKKFIIVEFDGAFYFNITSDETLFGFANNPTVRIHWIPISFWSDIRNYLRGDVVERYKIKYISVYNGSNIGNPPETDDGTNWSRLYLWPNTSDQNVYHQGEIVISENSQDNRLYICTVAGDGHDPYTNPGEEPGSSGCTFWEVWYP